MDNQYEENMDEGYQEDAEQQPFPEQEHEEGQETEAYMAPDEEEEVAEAAPEPVVEKPKKNNIGQRLSEVQREKYRLIEESERLRVENDRLRTMADASTQTALQHYDQAVTQRMEAAKNQKIKAFESGDINAQMEADVALSMATAELQQLNHLKSQQQTYQQPQYQPQQPYQQSYEYQQQQNHNVVKEWAENNTWFHPASDNYDEDLSNAVHAYCTQFDNNLYRAGQAHQIMSPEYLSLVDGYVQEARQYISQNKGRRDLQMKPSRGTVAPVRGGYSGQSQQGSTQKVKLTAEESDMARRLGVDDKTYLQHRMKDESENGHRRVRR